MRTESMKAAINLAKTVEGRFCSIMKASLVKTATGDHAVIPDLLKANLEKAGYVVTYHEGPGEDTKEGDAKHGAWVLVRHDGKLVARAFSHDKDDALIQAVYAEMKGEGKAAA